MRARWAFPLLVAGCFASKPPPSDEVEVQRGACTALEGVRFESLGEHECGLTPDGTAQCHWHVTIDSYDRTRSAYEWQYSDVQASGMIRCEGDQIEAYDVAGNTKPIGSYDATTGQLVWSDVVYIHGR